MIPPYGNNGVVQEKCIEDGCNCVSGKRKWASRGYREGVRESKRVREKGEGWDKDDAQLKANTEKS